MESFEAELLPILQPLIVWSSKHIMLTVFVIARVAGMLTVGPVFGQGLIPGRLRIPLVLIVSMFVVSALSPGIMDLSQSSTPGQIETPSDAGAPAHQFAQSRLILELPRVGWIAWSVKLIPALVSEFLVGFAIALAVMICLSGLQMAGLLIDRQSGAFIGAAYDPTLKSQSTTTGRFLVLFGLTVFIVMEPVGGHQQMVRSLLDSFQKLPPGQAVINMSTVELLSRLVHESLQLAVRFAAPAVAGASLLAMTTAWLGRSFRGGTTVTGYPLRVVLNLLVLTASLTGAAGAFVDHASSVIDRLVFG